MNFNMEKEIWVDYRLGYNAGSRRYKHLRIPVKQDCRIKGKIERLTKKYEGKENLHIGLYSKENSSATWKQIKID